MSATEGTTRRDFLELATLTAAVMIAGSAVPAGATAPTGTVKRTPLAQGRLGEPLSMGADGPSDVHVHHVTLEPGSDTGWHAHPGSELVVVTSGTVSLYLEDDGCEPDVRKAGEAFFTPPGVAHVARNEGKERAEVYVVYVVRAGKDPRIDVPRPFDCRP
jgi:quercetin dioxygenase-like cupin family protein